MADLYKVILPSGSTYDLKDSTARADIESLRQQISGGMNWIGVTTTAITDGSTTNPITIGGNSITATTGDVCQYNADEFAWNGTAWQRFGPSGTFGSLAFKNDAQTNYTPAGSVSQPTFTGTAGSLSVSGTPSGSVAIKKGTGATNYTPEGTVSAPTVTVTPNTGTVNSITDVGSLPNLTFTVQNEVLTIGWDAGTLPTKGANKTVVTGIKSAAATQPTFNGAAVNLEATFTGDELNSTGTYTPAGTVSKPTFTGTQATITVS